MSRGVKGGLGCSCVLIFAALAIAQKAGKPERTTPQPAPRNAGAETYQETTPSPSLVRRGANHPQPLFVKDGGVATGEEPDYTRFFVATDEGVLAVFDASEEWDGRDEPLSQLAYWHDFASEQLFFFDQLLYTPADVLQSIAAMPRDLPIDVNLLIAEKPELGPLPEITSPGLWRPAVEADVLAVMDGGAVAASDDGEVSGLASPCAPVICDPAYSTPSGSLTAPMRGTSRSELFAMAQRGSNCWCWGDGCTPVQCAPGSSCEDGNPCTGPDELVCFAHGCSTGSSRCNPGPAKTGNPCADEGNPCTDDVCAAGSCTHPAKANGTACPDEPNPCTDDVCSGGSCTHLAKPNGSSCPDEPNECTEDTCQGGACAHNPNPLNGSSCESDDRNCTNDVCRNGACMHEEDGCPGNECQSAADCTADDDPCTSPPVCVNSQCAEEVRCVPDDNPCTELVCTVGDCIEQPITGPNCGEFNPCLPDAQCISGECNPGTSYCEVDGNPCTTAQCLDIGAPEPFCTPEGQPPCGTPCGLGQACAGPDCVPSGCSIHLSSVTARPCETVELTLSQSCWPSCAFMLVSVGADYPAPYNTMLPPWMNFSVAPTPPGQALCHSLPSTRTVTVHIAEHAPPGAVAIRVTAFPSNGAGWVEPGCEATGIVTVDRAYPSAEVQYKSFIACNAIETDANFFLYDYYEGDDRWFSYASQAARSRQLFNVTLDPAHLTGLVGTPNQGFGTTFGYSNEGNTNDIDPCLGSLCPGYCQFCISQVATAECSTMAIAGSSGNVLSVLPLQRVDWNHVSVKMDLVAKNPCTTVLSAPGIDAHITFEFRQVCQGNSLGPFEFQLSAGARHDGFPWHELYLNGVAAYLYDPCSNGVPNPNSLFGDGDIQILNTEPALGIWRPVPE